MSKSEKKYRPDKNIIEYDKEAIKYLAEIFSLDRLREIKECYRKHFDTLMLVAEDQVDKINNIEEVEKYIKDVKNKVDFNKYIERLQDHINQEKKGCEHID
jgi:exopolysaccharide biosynthesis predicted pyruvyltransferase EpsI